MERVLKVDELRSKGMTVTKACKKVGIALPTYYEQKKRLSTFESEAGTERAATQNVRVDWAKTDTSLSTSDFGNLHLEFLGMLLDEKRGTVPLYRARD